jgi:hypothetical protein
MARSIAANFLSFGYSSSATPFTSGARFGHWDGFSICFHMFYLRHVFVRKPAGRFWR